MCIRENFPYKKDGLAKNSIITEVAKLTNRKLASLCPPTSSVSSILFPLSKRNGLSIAEILERYLMKKYSPSYLNKDTPPHKFDWQIESDSFYQLFQMPGFILSMLQTDPNFIHNRVSHTQICEYTELINDCLGTPLAFYRVKGHDVISQNSSGINSLLLIKYPKYILGLIYTSDRQ